MLGKKDFTSGGYIFNFRMASRLRSNGYEVEPIHFRTVPEGLPGNWLKASRYILRRVREAGPDLVIVSKSYQFVPLLRLFAGRIGVPVLYMMHHLEWMDAGNKLKAALYRSYVKWLLGMSDMVWANSRSTGSSIVSLGVPPDRVAVINPGFEKKGPAAPPPREEREGPVRCLCVGSISPRKQQRLLVEACAMLKPGSFRLRLAGSTSSDPAYAASVREMILDLGLQDSVDVSGELEEGELADAYRSADILVHPASWEAFGMSIIEAMWQGLPVVASNVAAIPELVVDGENGRLFEPGNAGELADALSDLVSDRELRLRMGIRSREMASARSDWNETEARFLELAVSVMEGRKK